MRRSRIVSRALSVGVALLVFGVAGSAQGSFPGRNGKIAYERQVAPGDYDIYVMEPDGSGRTRLTSNRYIWDIMPSWSPDGTKIAFASDRQANWDVYLMNADGSGQTSLTGPATADWDPTWSPWGTRIAFLRDVDDASDIFVMNADGTGQVNLTNTPRNESEPSWSPDGTRIAYTR